MNSTLGSRLKRVRADLSQLEMAAKVGIGLRTWQSYERDERIPDAGLLMRLAEMGVDVAWLVTGQGQPFVRTQQERVNSMVDADRVGLAGIDTLQKVGPLRAVSQPARLDVDKLRFALEVVEEALAQSGRAADPSGKAALVAKIYETFLQEADVAKATATVLRLIRTGT